MCAFGDDCEFAHYKAEVRGRKEKLEDYLESMGRNLADYSVKGKPLIDRESFENQQITPTKAKTYANPHEEVKELSSINKEIV